MQNFRFSGTLKSLDFREKFRIMSLTCFALLQTILKPAPKRIVGNSMGRVHVIIFWNNTFSSILNISHCTSYTSTCSSGRSLQARLGPSYQTRLSLQNDTLCAVVQSCTCRTMMLFKLVFLCLLSLVWSMIILVFQLDGFWTRYYPIVIIILSLFLWKPSDQYQYLGNCAPTPPLTHQ